MATLQRRKKPGCPIAWERILTVPSERFKSDSIHLVPLTDDMMALLETIPRWNAGDCLFSTTNGTTAINGFSFQKSKLDGIMTGALGDFKMKPWVLHDLRRSVRTRLSALKVEENVDGRKRQRRLTDQLAAAMQRLLAQMPKPADATDEMKLAAERERLAKERRAKALGPPNPVNRGMVMPPPSAEEIAARQAEMRRMHDDIQYVHIRKSDDAPRYKTFNELMAQKRQQQWVEERYAVARPMYPTRCAGHAMKMMRISCQQI